MSGARGPGILDNLLEKYPTIFYLEDLLDFNEGRFHGATLKLHTHTRIFSRISIASVDDKQHLSEVVFSLQLPEEPKSTIRLL